MIRPESTRFRATSGEGSNTSTWRGMPGNATKTLVGEFRRRRRRPRRRARARLRPSPRRCGGSRRSRPSRGRCRPSGSAPADPPPRLRGAGTGCRSGRWASARARSACPASCRPRKRGSRSEWARACSRLQMLASSTLAGRGGGGARLRLAALTHEQPDNDRCDSESDAASPSRGRRAGFGSRSIVTTYAFSGWRNRSLSGEALPGRAGRFRARARGASDPTRSG